MESNNVKYSDQLIHAFPEVCKKAKQGVQMCNLISTFLSNYCQVEEAYGKHLIKTCR